MAMTKEGIDPALASGSLLDGDLTNVDFTGVESDEYRLAPADGDVGDASPQDGVEFTPAPAVAESQAWQPETPLLPSDDWASKASVKSKQLLLIGSLAVAGLILSVIGFLAFMNWYGQQEPPPVLAQDPKAGNEQSVETPEVDSETAGPASQIGSDHVVESDTTDGSIDADAEEANSDDAVLTGEPDVAELEDPADVTTEAGAPEPDPSNGGDGENFNADDPFGDGSEEPVMTPVEKAQQALPNPRLAQFSPMLAWQVAPTIPENGVPLGPPPITAEDLGISSVVKRDPIPSVDWSEVSKTTVPAFIMGGERRPAQAIALWTTLSRVPTVADLDSLAASNFDPSKGIKIATQKDKSFAALARELAFQAGLEVAPRENRMVEFTGQTDAIAANLPGEISIAEWNADQHEWLVGMLTQMLDFEPAALQIDGEVLQRDTNRLNDVTWFRVLRLVDGLRQRLGAESVMTGYSKTSLSIPFLRASQVSKLENPVTSVAVQASPVGQKIAELGAQNGIHVWFDWPALTGAGVGPATTGLVVTYGRTLSQVLQAYARQFQLEVAIVNASTLLVTSEEGYRRIPRVFILPSQGRTVEQWKQDLEQLSPLNADGVGELRAVATPDSKHLIVRCCYPNLKY
ncbi:MAG: hypothetical protein ACE361_05495 [Aureliella sp.]